MTNFGLYTYTNASNAESGAELTEADKGDWYVVETEGIYIGYKYYETRYEDTVLDQGNATTTEGSSTGKAWNYVDEVTYPFGYGLSYTTIYSGAGKCRCNIWGKGTCKSEGNQYR